MNISQEGISLIKKFEGVKLEAYTMCSRCFNYRLW